MRSVPKLGAYGYVPDLVKERRGISVLLILSILIGVLISSLLVYGFFTPNRKRPLNDLPHKREKFPVSVRGYPFHAILN